ncbi:MAG: hypothetical protein AAB421_00390 [Patescibacteria group bacterium]
MSAMSLEVSSKKVVFAVGIALGLIVFFGAFPGMQQKVVSASPSSEMYFYSLSPLGDEGGRSVPASCPSNLHDDALYGRPCQATNACGSSANGVYQCGGICSVPPPGLPAGYGTTCQSSPNICGMFAYGAISCTGSCSAPTVPNSLCATCPNGVCDAGESGTLCPQDCGGGNGAPIVCTISTNPHRVLQGLRTLVTWSAPGATTCTITGTKLLGGAQVEQFTAGASGNQSSAVITEDTVYKLVCSNETSSCVSPNSLVDSIYNPDWEEL